MGMAKGEMANGKPKKGLIQLLRKFARDYQGLSAIEFALVFPVMATLYLGGTALTQGIVIKRKVTLVTRAVGDLTSQDTDIDNTEMNTIFSAAAAVMQPYPTTTLTLTITSLKVDKNGVGTVEWSNRSVNGGNFVQGRVAQSTMTLTDLAVPDTTVHFIMAEGTYTYTPPVGTSFVGTLPLSNTFYFRPRRVDCIKRNSTACTT
jgi:Flp pilus assembly protein TadG